MPVPVPGPAEPVTGSSDAPIPPVDWQVAPDIAQLNHGAHGAVPVAVAEAAARIRRDVEADPYGFFSRRLPGLLGEAREEIAAFLGADPAGLAFTTNATAAVQTVLGSLASSPSLPEGGDVVTTDHAYGAVRIQLELFARRTGRRLVVAPVPLPVSNPAEAAEQVLTALGPQTRLLVVDHVASPSALCFPVADIVAGARARGVPVLVDGAHAPGFLPVDVTSLGADFWTGNLHKWVCAPKSAAALCVAPQWREVIRPLVPSHHYGAGFLPAFDWTGTADPAPVLAAPAAVDLFTRLGWERIRERNRALAAWGAGVVSEVLGTSVPVGDALSGSMRAVLLPHPLPAEQARELERRLCDEHRVEVPVMDLGGYRLLRLSAQLYNTAADYQRLAAALPDLLAAVGAPPG